MPGFKGTLPVLPSFPDKERVGKLEEPSQETPPPGVQGGDGRVGVHVIHFRSDKAGPTGAAHGSWWRPPGAARGWGRQTPLAQDGLQE